jgi:hypothetical protein
MALRHEIMEPPSETGRARRRQACRSSESMIAVEVFMNDAG